MAERVDLERRVRAVLDAGGVFAELGAGELAGQAALALELAEHFDGRTAEFEAFTADQEFGFDERLWNLANI